MKHLLFFSICCLFLASCRDRREEAQPDSSNHIRFNNMAVGQTSRYVLFKGESYDNPGNQNFAYYTDTLVLTIIGSDANGFLVEEKMAPGSASLHGANHITNAEEVYQYYFKVENDTVFQKAAPGSGAWLENRLTYVPFKLPLAQITSPEVNITGWKTDHGYTESYWTGTDPAYSLFGIFYAHLNILTDNRMMAVDGPGSWYAYSAENGIVKTATYSWWTQEGEGWDLLPDQ
ncbi:MAG TPA: hypothetical protein PKL15_01820 [Saprospiraceae bacterium]|nr:hypothetical protein [Saprospiraceae bacterium]HNL38484.1 hypothetical protein [Saprospiraceae bacterium]HNM24130.1 hypothetical protein [Saprospiraceae bacterium]